MLEGTAVLWEEFQSTLPVRGATICQVGDLVHHQISIHAPREGSDDQKIENIACYYKFQSTLPVRGATRCAGCNAGFSAISIHAPREGSDLQNFISHFIISLKFQSTLPVRGATPNTHTCINQHKFQSTLPVRGATAKQHKGTGMFCDKCAIS